MFIYFPEEHKAYLGAIFDGKLGSRHYRTARRPEKSREDGGARGAAMLRLISTG